MTSNPVRNVMQALTRVTDYWSPRMIGRVNDQYVKVGKLKGQVTCHQHEHEDLMSGARFIIVLAAHDISYRSSEY